MAQRISLNKKILTLAAASVCFLSACQFKSPTLAEQQYLVEKGSFPAGAPDWIATPRTGSARGAVASSGGGLIPQTFTPSMNRDARSATMTAEESRSSAGTFRVPAALEEKKSADDDKEAASPLHRIGKLCPSVESEVNDALTTLDLQQRIRKYESLTVRCPQSADLWLWLGKDYAKAGDDVKAGRSYEKVLVIDGSNKEANELAIENRKKLNAGPGKKDDSAQAH